LGGHMRHILLLFAVESVVAAMIVASAMPAFAANGNAFRACDHAGAAHVPFCVV
jgi:hypothetical protein